MNKSKKSLYFSCQSILKKTLPLFFFILISGFQAKATDTIVTVRWANPRYVCSTQTFTLDVEFQCNLSGFQLKGMNCRFTYPHDVIEYSSFGDLAPRTGSIWITLGSPSSGMEKFGFPGPYEYVNTNVEKKSGNPNTFLPTSSWLKLFCINFHVNDPEVMNDPDFCPSVIWDMKENPAEGGMISSGGIVMNLIKSYTGPLYYCTENVIQFNWQYDTIPGEPFGFPVNTSCIPTKQTYSPTNYLPVEEFNAPGPVDIPVIVTNFAKIGHFNLVFEYDPAIMTYLNNTPNSIFSTSNGLLYVNDSVSTSGKNKITMKYQRLGTVAISLSDSAVLTNLHFTYITGTSDLTWKTTNNSCHYVDSLLLPKCDQPYSDYYVNGAVSLYTAYAPITKIDSSVAIVNDYVTYSVRVWNFENIYSGFLTLNYDPAILEFYTAFPDAAIASNFQYDASVDGTIQMDWSGNDTSLTDESVLIYLTFEYLGGAAPLVWLDNGSSCQYTGPNNIPLSDDPSENYYINGNITNADFIWTGDNSDDWNDTANWQNNIIPDKFTNVVLDASSNPSNWPSFNGNFTLGEKCKNLTLIGNAYFTSLGDFIINPGRTLNINGSGILQINGDWANSGIFNPGAGTVEFTGNTDGIIDEGVPPGNYVAAYVLSTYSVGMTTITGGSSGPSGDDSHLDVNIGFTFNYLGQNYSQVRINTNGWLSLNLTGDDAISGNNTILFNTSAPGTALAPWWDDLNADANTTVSYKSEGTTPSRVFIAEWKNILAFSTGSTVRLNFQVKLQETINVIEFCYGSVTGGTHSSSESASIGIKDATGGPGNFIEATRNSNTLILVFLNSGTNWPAVNYRFTPPVENTTDVFHKLVSSKSASTLYIQRPVQVTGTN
jgi:hypothetical protein